MNWFPFGGSHLVPQLCDERTQRLYPVASEFDLMGVNAQDYDRTVALQDIAGPAKDADLSAFDVDLDHLRRNVLTCAKRVQTNLPMHDLRISSALEGSATLIVEHHGIFNVGTFAFKERDRSSVRFANHCFDD